MATLQQAITNRLFGEYSEKRFVIVETYDNFLAREDVRMTLSYSSLRIAEGDNLDLRLWWECTVKEQLSQDPKIRFVFIQHTPFRVPDDISDEADIVPFAAHRLFPRYKWVQIKDFSVDVLEYLLNYPGRVRVNELDTQRIVSDYTAKYVSKKESIESIISEWEADVTNKRIDRPAEWMPKVANLIRRALDVGKYAELKPYITSLNERFQSYLCQNYGSVMSSATPTREKAPRIVWQVMPFLNKQTDDKIALIVVDGMNWWQGLMLIDSIKYKFEISVKIDTSYAWLPSVTELSRQAIFAGDYPKNPNAHSWQNECRMWEHYWMKHGFNSRNQILYEHSSNLAVEDHHMRVAWVTVDLDDKMHASDDFRYLYAATKLWVEEDALVQGIGNLLQNGFKIFITSDHGNIETEPGKSLLQGEKANADWSKRHITLAPEANKEMFASEHQGEVMQIDASSRTFYPVGNKVFSNITSNVTHGGTHFLEVLVPFITITAI